MNPFEEFVKLALSRLNKTDEYKTILEYFYSEWIYSEENLLKVSKDEGIWTSLKLPAVLKVELKRILEERVVSLPTSSTQLNSDEVNRNFIGVELFGTYLFCFLI